MHWILIAPSTVGISDVGAETANKEEWIWDTFFNAGYLSLAAALLWYGEFLVNIPNNVY